MCGVVGFTVLPIVAALPAATLGAAALVTMRRHPGERRGRGLALAGVVLGLVGGVVPLTVLLGFMARRQAGAEPMAVSTAGFGLGVLVATIWGLAGTGPGRGRAAAVSAGAAAGGLVGLALACLAAVGLAYLLWYGAEHLIIYIVHAIGDSIRKSLSGDP